MAKKPKEPKKKVNEIFALHFEGEIIESNIWKKFSEKYGTQQLYGWRPPKRLYLKLGHAKVAKSHLPEAIKDSVEIVRYVPEVK